jgi:GH43 family beta-xylosidase
MHPSQIRKNLWTANVLILLFVCGLQGAVSYVNPVISEIGPADPTVLYYEGLYYLYPTGDNVSYHVYTSYDLVHWSKGPKVFEPGGVNVWAPDVFYNQADGKFYLYYTQDFKIGVAVADQPTGPFVNQGILLNGFIDAHLFEDEDGSLYLYFSDVGHIYVQRMSSPTQLTGSRQMILQPSQSWEMQWGSVTEGPWMLKHNGIYYLIYSGSGADSPYYAVGYATAFNPMGPFTKYAGNPIVSSGNGVYGPGHGAIVKDARGNLWHLYHQKTDTEINWNRFICLDPLWFDGQGVLHGSATRGVPQPAPAVVENAGAAAYWRFEDGTPGSSVVHNGDNGVYAADVLDMTGNGNHLSVWQTGGGGGYAYRSEVGISPVPKTGAVNSLSVKNTGGGPAMWCSAEGLQTMTPSAFTVEAIFKLENGGYRTIVGRDSYGTNTAGATTNSALAALYFQAVPNNALAIKFCDVSGYWHEAVSETNIFTGFDFPTNPDGVGVPWYAMAAVSDGKTLSLYLMELGVDTEYRLIAQTDLTASGSPNTALTAGAGDGGDWDAGDWSVGRGLYDGGHVDRAYGYIDEVRISQAALAPEDFLCSPQGMPGVMAYWRFEEGPSDARVPHGGLANGQFYPAVIDYSGNGNHLSCWSDTIAGHVYRTNVPASIIPQTQEANQYSLQNEDSLPGLFTSSADREDVVLNLETWEPYAFTIEASFQPSGSGYRTIVGRDGRNVATVNGSLAALYFQLLPDDAAAIKFADVSGYWHEAVSPAGVIQYDGRWYHMAAVCDGQWLRLYLNDTASGLGYQLVAQTQISASGSPDTRLVADDSTGADWHGGGWSVARGLYNGIHTDRFYGLIDEIRISSRALDVSELLFYEVQYAGLTVEPTDLTIAEDGGQGQLFFSLKNPPAGTVSVFLAEQQQRGQVMLDRTVLTFTPADWNVPQAVLVTAVEDEDLENDRQEIALSVTVESSQDPDYDGLEVEPVIVTVLDNECGTLGYAESDFTLDCVIDIQDLISLAEDWLTCTLPGLNDCVNLSGQ